MKSLILALLICSITVQAQTSPQLYQLKGAIADSSTTKALDFVTVGLRNDKNQPIKSVLTDSKGQFSFTSLQAGKYSLVIVSVGYKQYSVAFDLAADKDMGIIMLSSSSTSLQEVTVMADRPLIRQDVDKIVYDLQADPESKANSVLDMMRKVPLLSVDADENIQLKGSGNYKILINGKPSGMVEKSPKDVLRSMPASSIQNIEVITNPPSKYDGEGLAGIINIITNKKVDNGYNGNVNSNYRFPVGGPGLGGSFNVKQGKFGTSGYFGINKYDSPEVSSLNMRTNTGAGASSLVQNGSRSFGQTYGYIGTELSYELDSLNLISGQFGSNRASYDMNSLANTLLSGNGSILQQYNLHNTALGNNDGWDASLNYQLGFKSDKNRLLTFSYRYYTYADLTENDITASERFQYNLPDYRQSNEGSSGEQTVQVDYVHPVKSLTIEGGIKGISRKNNSDFQFADFDALTGTYQEDPLRTNVFENTQSIWGFYNSYQYNLKNWGFKGGLRLERTGVDADFISTNSAVDQNYFNLIPNISVNRKFKNMSSVNFGFTQRIQRPSIWNLNPFIDRSNPNFESTGNPDLRPVLSNNFQLNYSTFKKGSVNIGLNYSFADNTIQRISVFDPQTEITRSYFENIGKDKSIGANFSVNYPITPRWNFTVSGNMNYVFIQGMINGSLVKNDGFRGYFYGSTGYRFEKGLRVNANFSYNTPFITLQGKGNSNPFLGLSVNKDIIKDKLSFSVSANNPFSKFRSYENNTVGPNFTQYSNFRNYFRSFGTTLNYRFGKLQSAIKKNKRGINNDDVSGGGGARQ